MNYKEKKILTYLFQYPIKSFFFYLKNPYLDKYWIFKIHFTLWIFAFLSIIFFQFISYLFDQSIFYKNINFTKKFITICFYPFIIFLIYQIDLLRVFYKKENNNNVQIPLNLLIFCFLPFSFTSIFWGFPNYIRFPIISISIIYSIYISYFSMKAFSKISLWNFIELMFVCIIYFMIFIFLFSFIFFLYKII